MPNQPEVKKTIPESEWNRVQQETMGLQEEKQHMRKEYASLLQDSERRKAEYDSLLEDFEECKTQLLKWQAPVQTSDDSMQKTLEKIHRAIDGWVYDAVAHVEDNVLYNLCLKEHRDLQKQQRCSRFEAFIKNSVVQVWGPYSCSNFLILSLVIQWILDEYVFREKYPLTVSLAHTRALGELEDAMKAAGQSRGGYDPRQNPAGRLLTILQGLRVSIGGGPRP